MKNELYCGECKKIIEAKKDLIIAINPFYNIFGMPLKVFHKNCFNKSKSKLSIIDLNSVGLKISNFTGIVAGFIFLILSILLFLFSVLDNSHDYIFYSFLYIAIAAAFFYYPWINYKNIKIIKSLA